MKIPRGAFVWERDVGFFFPSCNWTHCCYCITRKRPARYYTNEAQAALKRPILSIVTIYYLEHAIILVPGFARRSSSIFCSINSKVIPRVDDNTVVATVTRVPREKNKRPSLGSPVSSLSGSPASPTNSLFSISLRPCHRFALSVYFLKCYFSSAKNSRCGMCF